MARVQSAGLRLYMGVLHFGESSAVLLFLAVLLLATVPGLAQGGSTPAPEAVSRAVEAKLQADPALDQSELWATTRSGIVTLGGSTPSLLAKERATLLAETVRGVRTVINRLQVQPPQPRPTAEQLAREVEQALAASPALERAIAVTADDGGITLHGRVASAAQRQLAGEAAKGVAGVMQLDNALEVEPPNPRPDAEIEQELRALLRHDRLVDHALIELTVRDGAVRLAGVVGSAAERRRARDAAFLAGAVAVDDRALEVARWARDASLRGDKYARQDPGTLEQAIQQALRLDPRLDSGQIEVQVRAGRAALRGSVPSLRQARLAARDARNVAGILAVENRLEVRRPAGLKDTDLARQVRQALARNPFLHASRIQVRVQRGTVFLEGEVASFFERRQADESAATLPGIAAVKNALAVTGERRLLQDQPYVDEALGDGYDWADDKPAPSVGRSDEAIAEAIREQLRWNPFLNEALIHVSVDKGVATLSGAVSARLAAAVATANAYEGGARVVKNLLAIRPL